MLSKLTLVLYATIVAAAVTASSSLKVQSNPLLFKDTTLQPRSTRSLLARSGPGPRRNGNNRSPHNPSGVPFPNGVPPEAHPRTGAIETYGALDQIMRYNIDRTTRSAAQPAHRASAGTSPIEQGIMQGLRGHKNAAKEAKRTAKLASGPFKQEWAADKSTANARSELAAHTQAQVAAIKTSQQAGRFSLRAAHALEGANMMKHVPKLHKEGYRASGQSEEALARASAWESKFSVDTGRVPRGSLSNVPPSEIDDIHRARVNQYQQARQRNQRIRQEYPSTDSSSSSDSEESFMGSPRRI